MWIGECKNGICNCNGMGIISIEPVALGGSYNKKETSKFILNIMSKLRNILIFLSIMDVLIALIALMLDPEKLPTWLVFLSVILSFILVLGFCTQYVSTVQKGDWRIDLLYFILLYFCIIIGFTSAYYINKKDFKPFIQGEIIPENLNKEKQEIEKQKLLFNEDAKREYDKWKEIEDEKSAIITLIGQILNRRITEQKERFPLPDDPEPLYQKYEGLNARQNDLNNDLISYHKNYLAVQLLSEKTDAKIRRWSYFDFLYFSIVTITTVGYGDITPYTRWAKILVTLEILLGSALILIYLTLVMNRAGRRN